MGTYRKILLWNEFCVGWSSNGTSPTLLYDTFKPALEDLVESLEFVWAQISMDFVNPITHEFYK